jgi:hypothetical protein
MFEEGLKDLKIFGRCWLGFIYGVTPHCTAAKANQNEALLWKIAVLVMKTPILVPKHFVPRPCCYFTFLHVGNIIEDGLIFHILRSHAS